MRKLKPRKQIAYWVLFFFILSLTFTNSALAVDPILENLESNYKYGEIITIEGSNFTSNTPITCKIVRNDHSSCATTIKVTTDGNGELFAQKAVIKDWVVQGGQQFRNLHVEVYEGHQEESLTFIAETNSFTIPEAFNPQRDIVEELTLTTENVNIKLGQDATLQGELYIAVDPIDPVENHTLTFEVPDLNYSSSATTDSAGLASVTFEPAEAGEFNFTVTFAGEEELPQRTAQGVLTVSEWQVEVTTDDVEVKVGETAALEGTLFVDGAAAGSGYTLTFSISELEFSDSATTDSEGKASIEITPDTAGEYAFTVSFDGNATLGSASDSGMLTVNEEGSAPVANDDAYSVDEDAPLTVSAEQGVLANDTGGASLSAVKVSEPTNGDVTLETDGSFVYTPDDDFNGTDSFTYRANDGTTDSNVATVTITVNPVNDDPEAVDDTASTDEDSEVTIGVLSNDSDPDGDSLIVTGATDGANGTAVVNQDSTIIYTPNEDFHGTDTFTYTISDGNGGTDSAAVTVTVSPSGGGNENSAPEAVDDTATTNKDTQVSINVLSNDSDPDGDSFYIDSVTQGLNGGTVSNIEGYYIIYMPAAGFIGTDTFTYTISDDNSGTATATVTVTVTSGGGGNENNPPVAQSDSYTIIIGETLNITADDGVLDNDSDPDTEDTIIAVLDNNPNIGELTVTLGSDGSFSYLADGGDYSETTINTPDFFTYYVLDNHEDSSEVTTVTLRPAKLKLTSMCSEDPDQQRRWRVRNPHAVDVDFTWQVVGTNQVGEGTVAANTDDFFFTDTVSGPNTTKILVDGVQHDVKASSGAKCEEPQPQPAPAIEITKTVSPTSARAGETVTFTFTISNTGNIELMDVDITDPMFTYVCDEWNGILEAGESKTFTKNYTIPSSASFPIVNEATAIGYYGEEQSVSDTDTATVSRRSSGGGGGGGGGGYVQPNRPPVAVDDTVTTNYGVTVSIPVMGNDSDPDNDPIEVEAIDTTGTKGQVIQKAHGMMVYVPQEGFTGTDTFKYTIKDNEGLMDDAVVTVIVNPKQNEGSVTDIVVEPEPPTTGPSEPPVKELPQTGGSYAWAGIAGISLLGGGVSLLRRRFN